MPRSREIVDPRLLSRLRGFYPELCDIQVRGTGLTAEGEPNGTWSNVISDTPCAISDMGGVEVRRMDQTIATDSIKVAMQGYFPSITVHHRAMIRNKAYDIIRVDHDQRRMETYLIAELVNNG